MPKRIYIGYKKHKNRKTKKLLKQGPNNVLMEVTLFDQHTGDKTNSRFVRVKLDDAIRTRDLLQAQLDDVTELITDVQALLAEE